MCGHNLAMGVQTDVLSSDFSISSVLKVDEPSSFFIVMQNNGEHLLFYFKNLYEC